MQNVRYDGCMDRPLRAARVATFIYFVLCGTLMGTWVVHIPAIEEQSSISHATLGGLLVLLGLGAFAGMQLAGRLTDRLGAQIVVPVSGVMCAGTMVLPGLASGAWELGIALMAFGFFNGMLDVSMNAHAVYVEKAYCRPIMSAFHATFSVGGLLAALVSAVNTGVPPFIAMAATGGVAIVIALATTVWLLPASPSLEYAGPGEAPAPTPQVKPRRTPRKIWALAVLAMMVMLCEGAANDWSTLHLKDIFDTPTSVAAFAYGTYATSMTLGRLLADRLVARYGSIAILRYGSAAAAVGITIAALSPWLGGAFLGWALFGFGLSGCVPQLFSAAGHADPATAGANVSRVSSLGYLGMLAGPAVIGWLTHSLPLNQAFLVLTLMCVAAALSAGILRTTHPEPESAPAYAGRGSND